MPDLNDDLSQRKRHAAAFGKRKGGLPLAGIEALRSSGSLAIDPRTGRSVPDPAIFQ